MVLDNIDLRAFADNHTLYSTFNPNEKSGESNCVIKLSNQLGRIQTWMCKNRLKMNASKTEFILFCSPKQMKKCSSTSIPVVTDTVERSLQIRLLGAWFDENVTMKVHVTKKCSIAMWNLSKLKKIRKYLDTDTCKIVVDALVTSHLDYCNGLLFGISEYLLC